VRNGPFTTRWRCVTISRWLR